MLYFILLPAGLLLLGVGWMVYAQVSSATTSFLGPAVFLFPLLPVLAGTVMIILALRGLRTVVIPEAGLRKIQLGLMVMGAWMLAMSFVAVSLSHSVRQRAYARVQAAMPNAQVPAAKSTAFLWFWGVPFFVVGLLTPMLGSQGRHRMEWLKQNGRRVEAAIVKVDERSGIRVNGRSPWVVYCQAVNPDTKAMMVFKSNDIWNFPIIEVQKVKSLPVYIDPNHADRYYVDVSPLG